MSEHKIYIKNMVCPRCISAVQKLLSELNIGFAHIQLGVVILKKPLDAKNEENLRKELKLIGFELLSDKNTQLIERIKNVIIQMVHHQDDPEKIGHLSEQLPSILDHSYSYISSLFSEIEGITIEKYLIAQKIERAKELLVYSELNISEISYSLNYSSSQHFSRQFKTITGLSPSSFTNQQVVKRRPIDNI